MWLRSTFERAIDSFPFDTFIGALTASAASSGILAPAASASASAGRPMSGSDPSSMPEAAGRAFAFPASDSALLHVDNSLFYITSIFNVYVN